MSCCCPALPVNPVDRFRSLLEKLQVQLGVRKASSSRKQIYECILLLYAHEVRSLGGGQLWPGPSGTPLPQPLRATL
jgi:hypothetical protein